ncbi:MAG: SMP-30/gluconolactonase/LRE family protein [Gammaproteobacteria bacterium]|nr:SMP-30/gluconolactonase/LRE family protein [Gammaproteobacteria bacterium]
MNASPERVVDHPCVLGESPVWHPDEERLYWVDIQAGRVFCYDPGPDSYYEVLKADLVGGLTIQSDGSLLLFMSDGAVASFRNGALHAMPVSVPKQRGFRFNDCIVDPLGRVYSGTLAHHRQSATMSARAARKLRRLLRLRQSHKTGHVFRFDTDGRVTTVIRDIGRPNGMGFSPDRSRLYVTGSSTRTIYAYEFDEKHGMIANPRVFVRLPASARATPDGLTVDSHGFVWSAHMNGGCVVRYRPDGTEERRIGLPTPRVTSLSFGGADYADLYITTAGGDRRDLYGGTAGALFRVRPGVSGLPDFRSRIPT